MLQLTITYQEDGNTIEEQFEGNADELNKIMAQYRHMTGTWEVKEIATPIVVPAHLLKTSYEPTYDRQAGF